MRVLVCGGRDFKDINFVHTWLDKLFAPTYPNDTHGGAGTWLPRPDLVIITGGAKGVDSIAADWATINWVKQEEYLDGGKPDLIIAFPGGRGTADMVSQAGAYRIPVMDIPQR